MKASVIICTRNRAASLRGTLEALRTVRIPAGLTTEFILVDNGSTDDTAEVARATKIETMPARTVHEAKPGLSRARNCALRAATGDIIVFTDDDVRPAPDWLEKLTEPLAANRADAVAGAVTLAPYLERPWFTRRTRSYLSASEGLEDGWLTEMIGANMAFRREIVEKVPAFDEELGAGALGFGEETLFTWQIKEAGFRLGTAPQAVVEHHCGEDRLLRRCYLESAKKMGKTQAYLLHHWRHETITRLRARLFFAHAKLMRRRIISAPDTRRTEGCAEWEISLIAEIEKYRHYQVERRRQRNYQKHGLRKLVST